jgi:hypothetical protein
MNTAHSWQLFYITRSFVHRTALALDSDSSCDLGGEPHDALLWLAGHDGATLNTEKQYPYVSGTTGNLTKCSPKAYGVKTGCCALMQQCQFGFAIGA